MHWSQTPVGMKHIERQSKSFKLFDPRFTSLLLIRLGSNWVSLHKAPHCPWKAAFHSSSIYLMLSNCLAGEDSWESLGLQGDQTKGNQPWIFTGRADAEAEAPILWPPDVKNWLIGKDPDAGKDWRQEEKETTEDELVGWHHRLDGHEFEQVPGAGDGQGSLACCSPWGRIVRHDWATELNWTDTWEQETARGNSLCQGPTMWAFWVAE